MAENIIVEKEFSEAPRRVSEWRRFWRVFLKRRIVIFGIVIFALLLIAAVFANVLAPYNPYVGIMADSLQQPSVKHL
jgi:ABC-type antimicrobial peptide transport system permease subunit